MKNTGKWILVFSALFLLFGHFTVHAEKVGKTVQDCLKNPDACEKDADMNVPSGGSAEQAGITGWEILKTVLVLFLVLGLLFLFLRWLQKRNMRVLSTGVIKHLGGTNVGMNRSVQLIRLGKSILVLGVGENVQLLKEVRDEKEVEELLRQYEESVPFQTDFKNLLLKWKDARTEKKNPVSPPPSFSGMLKRTLEEAARRRKEVLQDEEKGNRDP